MRNLIVTSVTALLSITACCNSLNHNENDPERGGRELWKAGNFDSGGREKCGTKEPTPEQMMRSSEIKKKWEARLPDGTSFSVRKGKISIPVYFHVIELDDRTGGVTDYNIKEQVKIMNKKMKHFQFDLKNVTRTQNSYLCRNENSDTAAKMVESLREGGFDTLNIFVARPPNYWGWALTPSSWENPGNLSHDYVLLHAESFPRDSYYDWVKGYTALHETGHWLGLWHTFQGGCDGNGILDIPAERDSAEGCPRGRDTCPDNPGDDPIDNFMDYSSDDCQKKFSPDQTKSMMAYWYENRALSAPQPCTEDSHIWKGYRKNGKKSRKKSCKWVAKKAEERCNVRGKEHKEDDSKAFEACCESCAGYSSPESGGQ